MAAPVMSSEFMEGDMSALRVIDIPDERPALSLELPDTTTFGEWLGIGRRLRLGSQALNWHIGDWWKFGVSHWGEDKTRKSALEIWGVEGETARVYGWVATKFQPVSRLTELSFSHYQEAASLPADQARDVLGKAAREHLSKAQLRREVQAIKAANDPQPGDEPRQQTESKPLPAQSARAELTVAYEMVIEFAEALEKERSLTKRERRLFTLASEFVGEAHAGHRSCPDDFDVIFVEQGRLECEAWYRASRLTVNRWLLERGKSRLIKLRADFLKHQRDAGRPVVLDPDVDLPPIDEALHAVAKQAAHFLRVSRYGGWTVTANDDGTWLVGTVRRTSDELIAMAERQGFDSIDASATLQGTAAEGVEA
jgi:hypothetical protein